MRFPEFLKKNGTIGFVAPSFGCNIEPYKTSFNHALEKFHDMGYQTMLGPNLSLIHISEPTRPRFGSRMPSSA